MMTMTNPEFAQYTSDLNAAASRATRLLIDRHDTEYEAYLEAEMNRLGYSRVPYAANSGRGPNWRKDIHYGQ
jgi:transposase